MALLSWPLYNERPSLLVWLSVVSSVFGVALITYSGGSEATSETLFQDELAVGCALTASIATAVAMLGLHRLQYLHPWAIVVHFSGVAVLFCLVSFSLGGHLEGPPPSLNAHTLLLLLAVGATATVGQLFLTKAFAAGPPAKVSVVSLTQVVFAMLLDVWLWGHQFRALTLVGMGLIVAPTAWLMASRAADVGGHKLTTEAQRHRENKRREAKRARADHLARLFFYFSVFLLCASVVSSSRTMTMACQSLPSAGSSGRA